MTRKGSISVRRGLCLVLTLGGLGLATEPGVAQPRRPASAKAAEKPVETEAPASDVEKFCANNAALVGDARLAWQTARLREIEAEVRRRLAELDAKKAEFIDFVKKRDAAMRQATEAVVAIYARMRPEAAAQQLAAMDDAMAAAVLAKLPRRAASTVLNEMDSRRGARLARKMVGPGGGPDETSDSRQDGK